MVTIAKTKQPVRMPRFGHRVDKTDPILRGCVGWWPLNDGAGRFASDLIANDQAVGYGTTAGMTWDYDERGCSVRFDDVDDYFQLSTDFLSSLANSFSVSLWAKPADSADDQRAWNLDESQDGTDWSSVLWYDVGGLNVGWVFGVRESNNFTYLTDADIGSGADGKWSHVIGTYSGDDRLISLYVDGLLVDSTATSTGTLHSPRIYNSLGGNFYAGEGWFDGNIQNARIWNRALSATEVSRLYSEPWAGLEPLSPFSFFSGLSQIYAYYSAAFLQRLG